jgi:hypothetical protein
MNQPPRKRKVIRLCITLVAVCVGLYRAPDLLEKVFHQRDEAQQMLTDLNGQLGSVQIDAGQAVADMDLTLPEDSVVVTKRTRPKVTATGGSSRSSDGARVVRGGD